MTISVCIKFGSSPLLLYVTPSPLILDVTPSQPSPLHTPCHGVVSGNAPGLWSMQVRAQYQPPSVISDFL